jgi:sugar lactone lactonase YvrE
LRFEPDGSRVRHVDLTHITPYFWSEMTVDGRGNIYVNSIGFDFAEMGQRVQNPAAESAVGVIALITLDGVATQVADAIAFPNGMVITPAMRR